MGTFYNKPVSISPEAVATFYTSPSYKMKDYVVLEEDGRTSSSTSFSLRDPEAPGYNTVVSLADSDFDGQSMDAFVQTNGKKTVMQKYSN